MVTKTQRALKQFTPKKAVLASMGGQPLELPNYSGMAHHSRERSENYTIDNLIVNGDTYWETDGSGLDYGHMYDNSTIAVTISSAGTPVEIGDTWTTGQLNSMTFGASHYLIATRAGRYKIDWSASIAQNSPSAKIEVEIGIMINGTASVLGASHRTLQNASDTGASAGTAIVDLAANDQISLYVTNETNTTNIDIEHANVTAIMVGGT